MSRNMNGYFMITTARWSSEFQLNMLKNKYHAKFLITAFFFHLKNTDLQAVDSSGNGRTQRKRPHTADNTEMGQTKRSKKSTRSSSSKDFLATNGHDHATNKKDTKTSNDKDKPTIKSTKRKKQVIPTGSLSSSESEGSLHLSDQSDSLHVTENNTGELGEQSDRQFLQQQIKILKTPFQLENDCPTLSRMKGIP